MRVPGRAWLEFEVSEEEGKSKIRQTAVFDPVGLLGLAYWYALYPLHQFVFAGMLGGIAREASRTGTAFSKTLPAGPKGPSIGSRPREKPPRR